MIGRMALSALAVVAFCWQSGAQAQDRLKIAYSSADASNTVWFTALDAGIWQLAPGQISGPFEGLFGYEIVQVKEQHMQPLDQVRENVTGIIKAEALEQRQQEIISAAQVTLAPQFKDAPLPCETPTRSFTLKDPLQTP